MAKERIREPVIAGSWYPGEKKELSKTIREFLRKAEKQDLGNIRVLVAPHAGYIYSGQVAAYAYKQVEGKQYSKVVVLAPSHHVGFRGLSIIDADFFRTPLGDVRISPETKELLKETDLIKVVSAADREEHSLEIHVPFLQEVLDDFELIPLICGDLGEDEVEEVAGILLKHMDEDTLVVASTDLSHFYPYDTAVEMDRECIDAIVSLELDRAVDAEMCGKIPVLIAITLAKKNNWKTKLLQYMNSGDVTGDRSGVVGYAAIAFYEKKETKEGEKEEKASGTLTNEEKKYLLKLARDTIEAYVKSGEIFKPDEVKVDRKLRNRMAAFVTLEKNGQLRGCIGHLNATEPLYLDVRDNAINAAAHDPRFPPVREEELDEIEIEVSVLTTPTLIKAKTPEEYLEKIRPGVDGLIIEYGGRGATYLPQVWEQIPDKIEFLESLCMKAGLPPDTWKKKDVKIYRYEVEAFREGDY